MFIVAGTPRAPIIHELIKLGTEVTVYDPHCNESFGARRANSLHEAIKGADCIPIITDHTGFKKLNLKEIKALMKEKPAIIDGRRIINPHIAEESGFAYYGIGLGQTTQKIRRLNEKGLNFNTLIPSLSV